MSEPLVVNHHSSVGEEDPGTEHCRMKEEKKTMNYAHIVCLLGAIIIN